MDSVVCSGIAASGFFVAWLTLMFTANFVCRHELRSEQFVLCVVERKHRYFGEGLQELFSEVDELGLCVVHPLDAPDSGASVFGRVDTLGFSVANEDGVRNQQMYL
jgi:hypothetical protein